MGGLCTSGDAETAYNRKINREQANAERQQQLTMKLLLLGTGDSGKTTLRKQMRNIYGEGFTDAARKQLATVILGNLIDGAKDIINAMPTLNPVLHLSEAAAAAAETVKQCSTYGNSLTPEFAEDLKKVLEDASFEEAVGKRTQFQLQDCWLSFAEEFRKGYPAWGGPDWTPSVTDCVAVRVRTSGIVEEQFVIDNIVFNMFDVGGQRAERRKWIHSFDNVTAVIFVTAISEYDQVLFEDYSKNRLQEAVELFEEICNSRWFLKTSMLLFFNKRDLFERKFLVDKVPLNVSGLFPDAPETNDDMKKAIDWMSQLFLKKKKVPEKDVYIHVTTATDPANVRAVFDVCRNVILKRNLANSGFLADGSGSQF